MLTGFDKISAKSIGISKNVVKSIADTKCDTVHKVLAILTAILKNYHQYYCQQHQPQD